MHLRKAVGFAPESEAEGEGPQSLGDVMKALLKENYSRLLRYVRRHLWHATTAGEVPRDAIDPRGVVNEVARKVFARPEKKPALMEDLLWFYVLARQELVRRIRNLKRRGRETVSLEEVPVLPEDWAVVEGYDAEQPLDIIERQADPPLAWTHELLPDGRERRPDEAAAQRDLLSGLRRVVSGWPREEREVFELYFVEGFEPEEIAMVMGLSSGQVKERIATVQQRLRAAALEQALV